MQTKNILFGLVIVEMLLAGCSNQQASTVESEKQKWSREGWKYFETFGAPANDAVDVSQMSSTTARSVTAFASVSGVSTNHIYHQTNALYLVVTMQRPSGDTFALVFEKPKP
jgi:PBP1b-binding outer membrane lipoprotein LpoB